MLNDTKALDLSMTFTNTCTFIKLALVEFALYVPHVTLVSVFDGFACGFRFWLNFLGVVGFG